MVIEVSESQYKPNISEEKQQHSFVFFRSIECIQLEGLLFISQVTSYLKFGHSNIFSFMK